ncbi:MAG: RodZ domain-containing protein [Arenimonas sp.]
MSTESFQSTLFEDPVGLRFRHARQKQGWALEVAAQKLKLPVAILDAIEREDWPRLGAPIFVRSYVGSYAKLLGLPVALADEVVRGKPDPQLVSLNRNAPTPRAFDRGANKLGYLAMTLLLIGSLAMLAVYFQGPARRAEIVPLDAPVAQLSEQAPAPAAQGTTPGERSAAGTATAVAAASSTSHQSVMASFSAALPGQAPTAAADIVLRFRGASWLDALDRNGVPIERGVMPAGSERHFSPQQLAQVTVGDADAVEVLVGGVALDLTAYRNAKIARFTVSSAGSITPVAGE